MYRRYVHSEPKTTKNTVGSRYPVPLVLLHNGVFYNGCTMKRCLHRKVDFKTNAMNNAHVSQLLPYYIHYQNKLVASGYKSQNTTC